jgi:hypothetical protein
MPDRLIATFGPELKFKEFRQRLATHIYNDERPRRATIAEPTAVGIPNSSRSYQST